MPSSIDRYFDNAATTPVDPRVLEAMLPFLGESCGNAHSIHAFGLRARDAVENARESVAGILGAEDPAEIVFTSGATESNNWVLRAHATAAISPFEHSSVREPALRQGFCLLENQGLNLPGPKSRFDLVSIMRVNNEIGSIFEPAASRGAARLLHSDVTQALGKIPTEVASLGVDFASFSSHKLYGPKGIGGLYARGGAFPEPMLLGGEHENGLRAGTLNVPAIVGFGEAARIARSELHESANKAREMRAAVLDSFEGDSDLRVNGGERVSPFILSLSFRGIEGETLVLELDRAGFAISGGAACSSRSAEPSHVLSALGMEPDWLRGTIRISFGRQNTLEGASQLGAALKKAVGTLRNMKL